VFESLGKLHVKSAKGKDLPRPLTGDAEGAIEAFPAFSRDGSQLVYVRWSDAKLGEIMIADAMGQNRRVLTGPGHFGNLAFSPDGTMIAFEKREGGYLTSADYSEGAGIYVMSLGGGEAKLVTRDGANPQWGAGSDRLFMLGREGGGLALVSTDLNGEAKRVHAKGDLANDLRIAPDGRTIAFRQNYEVFAMPVVPGGEPVDVSEKGGSLPVTKVSTGGADYLGWANGGATLFWSIGPSLQSAQVSEFVPAAPKAETDKSAAYTPPTMEFVLIVVLLLLSQLYHIMLRHKRQVLLVEVTMEV
jgi:dipeptidyl aminopeptidase/acylaminoacyl peptidase